MAERVRSDQNLVTAEELLRRPRGRYREYLLRGRVVEQEWRGALSGHVSANLLFLLDQCVREELGGYVLGPCGYQLESDPDTVLAPSISYFKAEPGYVLSEGYHDGPPDLAVELADASEKPDHLEVKLREWMAARCPMVLVVDPKAETVTIHRPDAQPVTLTTEDVLDAGEIVPGFRLPVAEIFK